MTPSTQAKSSATAIVELQTLRNPRGQGVQPYRTMQLSLCPQTSVDFHAPPSWQRRTYTAILGHVFKPRPEITPSSDREQSRKQPARIKIRTRSGHDDLERDGYTGNEGDRQHGRLPACV
ncbi:hypothetical protein HBI56_170480 [Parastagonospora nodorum]|uniref:Uncharacterized protein n=1 Tax=Phaeosphaeria nodorum (strain SN15 / ATCC MYA-4574 / FGSC 10173) TaxID=321614 RepID=A0A7U2FF70_PHANO|nr:hypothetical protein HBH56_244990 [Parastagonospora nodorum]QRD01900.1 hypothetical protein JI435_048760 [Parastagonospora nodorum SN15]KAH3935459.1 hypothetical protein HBH54_034050 [Parastagonospora nodorum]KAH3938683.1 hypothetical protein HBH53_247420 [Parastagonospora nodorum]KAH3964235.1 hypothetical protein HBH51_159910 [Parastagonospora nodorum]